MKRDNQYRDSSMFAGYAMLGGVILLVSTIIYNCIVNGI